mgnify:CR=1 FL=1
MERIDGFSLKRAICLRGIWVLLMSNSISLAVPNLLRVGNPGALAALSILATLLIFLSGLGYWSLANRFIYKK